MKEIFLWLHDFWFFFFTEWLERQDLMSFMTSHKQLYVRFSYIHNYVKKCFLFDTYFFTRFCMIHFEWKLCIEFLGKSQHNDTGTYRYIIHDMTRTSSIVPFYEGTRWITKQTSFLYTHVHMLYKNGFHFDHRRRIATCRKNEGFIL